MSDDFGEPLEAPAAAQPSQKLSQSAESSWICCVGMCVLDIIHVVEEFPTEDSDKRCLSGYWQRGGNASNNCTVLRKLGALNVEFLGMLSSSEGFAFLYDDCHKRRIAIENCPKCDMNPPFSSVILNKANGSRTIVHSNSGFPVLTYEHFTKLDLSKYGWIHFEARYPAETILCIRDIRAYNRKRPPHQRITISVDLEKMSDEILVLGENSDLTFLGKDLAKFLNWQNPQQAVKELFQRFQPQEASNNVKPCIICPWGSDGAACIDAEGNYLFVPSQPVTEIVDSLGAGDTFAAATIYAMHVLKQNLVDAVRFSHAVASFKLAHRGYDDIENFKWVHEPSQQQPNNT